MSIKLNETAVNFTLFDTERKEISLYDFKGKKIILAFFPGAFTGVCTKEMCALRDSMEILNSLNAQVVGISVDSPFANKAFATHNQLNFPILSDYTRAVSKLYSGIYEDFAGLKGYSAAKRAIFIIDQNLFVKYIWSTQEPGVEPPYEEIKKRLAEI